MCRVPCWWPLQSHCRGKAGGWKLWPETCTPARKPVQGADYGQGGHFEGRRNQGGGGGRTGSSCPCWILSPLFKTCPSSSLLGHTPAKRLMRRPIGSLQAYMEVSKNIFNLPSGCPPPADTVQFLSWLFVMAALPACALRKRGRARAPVSLKVRVSLSLFLQTAPSPSRNPLQCMVRHGNR